MSHAGVISINFTDGGNSNGDAVSEETAGAIPAAFWNTINGKTGKGQNNTNNSSLTDRLGRPTGVSISQSAHTGAHYNTPFCQGFSGNIANETMTNFADTSTDYSITLKGLHQGVGKRYDVYLYSARNLSNTGVSQFEIAGQRLFLSNKNTHGDYKASGFSSQAEAESHPDSGNYVLFKNITQDTLTLNIKALTHSSTGGHFAALNAIQIVPSSYYQHSTLISIRGFSMILRR